MVIYADSERPGKRVPVFRRGTLKRDHDDLDLRIPLSTPDGI